MSLAAGDRLGVYEVLGSLGAGGMGEVYRARDSRLQREVAIKVLPAAFAEDADRLARFQREAQVLASLNHPNIAAIHGVEETAAGWALVLELVEGPTLAERLAAGPLPLDEALPLAIEIASALEAAHDKGIIHRDLKPANIKVTSGGMVKVLDFGLAKVLEGSERSSALSLSPTLSVHATYAGVILGTAAYMSPEQARGKPVDRRTDIWGFGCVLFEMLAGTQAFDPGETVSDAVAAVLTREPDWSALPAHTPAPVVALLRRCLQKDPRARLPHIGVARLDLQESPATAPVSAVSPARAGQSYVAWSVAAFATTVAAALAAALLWRPAEQPVVTRSAILPPDEAPWAVVTPATRFALSPDGTRLAFIATGKDGAQRLWVRSLDATTAQPLLGTEGVVVSTWSPDSRWLAFVANGVLKKIEAGGGPATTLAAPAVNTALAWGADTILFSPTARSPLSRVPPSGGEVRAATVLDADAGDTAHWMASFLPDGRRFLYLALGSATGASDARAVYAHALDSADAPTLLLQGGSNAKFAGGHLLFMREATLMAQPFDADRLELAGEPRPLAEHVQLGGTSGRTGAYSVSAAGVLVYQTGAATSDSQLRWVDHGGKVLATLGEPADQLGVEISPDGTRVLTTILDPGRRSRSVWIYDVARGLRSRFTFGTSDDPIAIWSPDARTVLFSSQRDKGMNLYTKPASGVGAEEPFVVDAVDKAPSSWSRDGTTVVYWNVAVSTAGNDLWMVPASGNRTPTPLVNTSFNERHAVVSPDGRWLAYSSNESGTVQVYVKSFPRVTGTWQVSIGGGAFPRWRHDGRAIVFLAPDNQLTSADVDGSGESFRVGAVTPLFETDVLLRTYAGLTAYPYDLARDGRILLNVPLDTPSSDPITLLTNWTGLLTE